MGNKLKKNEIETLVLKHFIHTIQRMGLYHRFIISIYPQIGCGSIRDIYIYFTRNSIPRVFDKIMYRSTRTDNPFKAVKTYTDFKEILSKMPSHDFTNKKDETEMMQEYIMLTVNDILHYVMEPVLMDKMDCIEKIGETVYTNACKEIWGDAFEDKMVKPQECDISSLKEQLHRFIEDAKSNGIDENEAMKMALSTLSKRMPLPRSKRNVERYDSHFMNYDVLDYMPTQPTADYFYGVNDVYDDEEPF